MKYTILSIDDSRKQYKDEIRRKLAGWTEVQTECVDGKDRAQLDKALEEFGVSISPRITVGEAGCTLSTLRALEHYGEILVLNDDAILADNFVEEFEKRIARLPLGWDIFSAFVPRDHDDWYYYGHTLKSVDGEMRLVKVEKGRYSDGHPMFDSNGVVSRSYHRYGGVALFFSEQGKSKYRRLNHIQRQADDIIYLASYLNQLKAYTSIPELSDLVTINPDVPTTVHNTERYYE